MIIHNVFACFVSTASHSFRNMAILVASMQLKGSRLSWVGYTFQLKRSHDALVNMIFEVPICLSIFNSIIVPGFIRKITTNHQSLFILLLRSINCFIIPVIIIFILVPNCLNNWVLFWSPCYKHNLNNFTQSNLKWMSPYRNIATLTSERTMTLDILSGTKYKIFYSIRNAYFQNSSYPKRHSFEMKL